MVLLPLEEPVVVNGHPPRVIGRLPVRHCLLPRCLWLSRHRRSGRTRPQLDLCRLQHLAYLQVIEACRQSKLGLCYKCNAKWSRDHHYPQDVLATVEAIWDSFSSNDSLASSSSGTPENEQLLLAISKSAISGVPAARTVRLLGTVQQIPVQVLVDFGSSSSFVNAKLASQLQGLPVLSLSSSVQVAGGGILHSDCVLQRVPWIVGDCTFHSDLRVLSLGTFDIVISMDWLEEHSPMLVDWRQKQLSIPYAGEYKLLPGVAPGAPTQLLLQIESVLPESSSVASQAVPGAVQQLLDDFQDIF